MENALIAGGLLTLFVLPVYLFARRSQQKRKALLADKLHLTLTRLNLELTRSEYIGTKMLAWDQPNRTLLYADQNQPEVVVHDLRQAVRSYMIKSMNGTSVRSIILQIANPQGKLLCSIPFFQQFSDNEMKLKLYEKQAREWEQLLNTHLVK